MMILLPCINHTGLHLLSFFTRIQTNMGRFLPLESKTSIYDRSLIHPKFVGYPWTHNCHGEVCITWPQTSPGFIASMIVSVFFLDNVLLNEIFTVFEDFILYMLSSWGTTYIYTSIIYYYACYTSITV